jgi:hypothetical protein
LHDEAALARAPKAGLNRRDLARHYNEKSAGERFPRAVPASGFLIRAVAKHHVPGRSMMMNASELRDALGPLAQSLPRVFLILLCGAVAIIAAVEVVRAVRGGQAGRVLAAWIIALVGVVDGCLAFRSFARLGGPVTMRDPLSPEGLLRFASGERLPIGAAAVTGALLGAALWRRRGGRDAMAAAGLAARHDRAVTIGALGEALVAGILRDLGYPMLRNVILRNGGHSVEIDALVRVPDGVLVLETKTWSGFVAGAEDALNWTRHGRDGQSDMLPNAVRQNTVHVAAVESLIADLGVRVRGHVISAGTATFAIELMCLVVPVAELRVVMRGYKRPTDCDDAGVSRAWARLQAEAMRSELQRAAHIARVRSRKGLIAESG